MERRALPLIFIALWTSGYVVGALALRVMSPLVLLEVRYLIASLITIPVALRTGRWRGAPFGRLIVLGLLLQVVQFVGIYGGIAAGVPAGLSALVVLGLSPLLTTALAVRGGQQASSRRLWLGLCIGLLGVVIGLVPDLAGASVGAALILTFVGMAGLSSGTVLQKHFGDAVDSRVSAAVQSLTALSVFTPAFVIFGGHAQLGCQFYLTAGYLGLGMGVAALIVLLRMIKLTSATTVASLLLLVPALTALVSVPALGQPLHPFTLVGMAVSGLGVALALGTGLRLGPIRARARPQARPVT